MSLWNNWGDERGCDEGHWHAHTNELPWGLPEVIGTVEQVHCSRRRLLRRGVEFHMCTTNKSAPTKKVWKLIVCPSYFCVYEYIYIFIYIYMSVYMYTCLHICIYVCTYLYIYIYIYICVCVCVCMYVSNSYIKKECDGRSFFKRNNSGLVSAFSFS